MTARLKRTWQRETLGVLGGLLHDMAERKPGEERRMCRCLVRRRKMQRTAGIEVFINQSLVLNLLSTVLIELLTI